MVDGENHLCLLDPIPEEVQTIDGGPVRLSVLGLQCFLLIAV